jgi:initiation factor 1A
MYQSRIRQNKNRDARKRELLEPDEGQTFAIVQDMVGNGRLRAFCADKVVRMARIRGSMRKYSGKVIIDRNDLILVAYRDFHDETVDVIHKYKPDEVHYMMRHNMLPENIVKKIQMGDETEEKVHGDDYLMFMDQEMGGDDNTTPFQKENSDDTMEEEDIDIDAI